MIYLDNNATTFAPPQVLKTMVAWMNKGNPSAGYKSATECQSLMADFRKYIAERCNFIAVDGETNYPFDQRAKLYHVIFTSGASESNNCIIRSIVNSYKFYKHTTPHIIVSAVEHRSILECVEQLAQLQMLEVTIVKPNVMGFIEPEDVRKAIRNNTALISIMSANNETGCINNIKQIGEFAHDAHVPFHTDAVQTFGKFMIDPVKSNVDAFSISFHKLHSDKGVGALIIKKQFMDGFKLLPQICGTQNGGFRGGTENISGIAGAFEALKYTWHNREDKNKLLLDMKREIIKQLSAAMPCQMYHEYLEKPTGQSLQLVFLSTAERNYLPNTLMLAVVKTNAPLMCNVALKKKLEERGVIVSIGSACNTSNAKASHVITAMEANEKIRRGVLRISLGDTNTLEEMNNFVTLFLAAIRETVDSK